MASTTIASYQPSEIVFLVNDAGHVHVVRDLHGELVFDDNKAVVCFPHQMDFDRFSLLQIRLEIVLKGAPEVSFVSAPCSTDFINNTDIVVVARWLLFRSSKETAQALLDAVDKGELSQIGVLTQREIKERRDNESLKSLEIEDGIEKSINPGYGIVATDNMSSIVCQTANDDHPKAHEALINWRRGRLEYEFQSMPSVVQTSIESAFIRVKRGECRAIYATAENLKDLLEGFKRDKVSFHVLPIWFTKADLDAAMVEVAKAEALCAQQWQDLKRKRDGDAALIKLRARQSGEERQNREDELRKQYGSAARALEKMIFSELKEYVESPTERHLGVRQKYPQFVNWFEGALRDGWELLSIDRALSDYGIVEWKGRVLEAGFAEARLRMQNRDRGEYQDNCYVFGYVLDKEFDRARDAVVVKCNEQGAIERYKLGQRFSSRWIAEALPPSGTELISTPLPPEDCGGPRITPAQGDKRTDLGSDGPSLQGSPPAENDGEAMVRRLQSVEANARQEVSGPVIRPGAPAVRFLPLGTLLECRRILGAAARSLRRT